MASYEQLREQYPVFRYHAYTVTQTETTIDLEFHFEIEGLAVFKPRWSFKKSDKYPLEIEGNRTFADMVFALGMVELVSYWKITCSPRVEILAGAVDEKQAAWFKNLYFHGLGEFFYVNGIPLDPCGFMQIVSCGEVAKGTANIHTDLNGCLIPVGGGKDSVVTLELLKAQKQTNFCYIINPRGASLNTAKVAGYTEEDTILAVKRTLDPTMLQLNKQGFLNGHTPFSAIVAFSSLMTAYIHHLQYIVLSNESSANESTVADSTVNHQYSKSFAFEKDFNDYEAAYIRSGISYFSLLRPLSEYQIAMLFAKAEKYHTVFRSCNAGSKQDIWCCNCPKCLFVYQILSPFLSQEYLAEAFGSNMLDNEALLPIYKQLLGITPEKPFECVGSRDEVNTAAVRTIEDLENNGKPLPTLLRYYKSTPLYEQYAAAPDVYTQYYETENLLPTAFDQLLREKLAEVNA